MKKLVALFAVVAAFFAVSCGGSDSPGDVAIEVYELVADGKYEKALDKFYVADPAAKEEFKSSMLSICEEKMKPQMEAKGGIEKIELVSEEISEDGKSARVTTKITYGDGTSEDERTKMVNVDGEWLVSMEK